ncbi:uncharacterized protein [Zea mays]|uniref:uncharacterized protein n=1 Tax=Zea mays TaxID=4577 RepID=UPI0004DEB8C8|nr:uncharacterized protein LOC111589547 [Zea mays]|eukprot:XP_023156166.1 uncharacterized protein LOC111589547 [Zea mays]
MTMEDIFRATTSSSINHHAVFVFEFENVQMELKQLAEAEDDGAGAAGQTGKVEEEVQSNAEGGSNQEGRPGKMGQIMGWASKSLKPQILQARWEGKSVLGHWALMHVHPPSAGLRLLSKPWRSSLGPWSR